MVSLLKTELLVVGDACLDIDLYPGELKGGQREIKKIDIVPGGSAGNTAYVASMLGIDTAFITTVANDTPGYLLKNLIKTMYPGLKQRFYVAQNGETCSTVNIIDKRGVRKTYFKMNSYFPRYSLKKINNEAKILHVSGYTFEITEAGELASFVKRMAEKTKIVIDLYPRIFLYRELALEKIFPYTHIVIGTLSEYMMLLGTKKKKDTIEMLRKMEYPPIKIVTLGGTGSIGLEEHDIVKAPTMPLKNIVKLKGAGDSFNAGVIYGVLKEKSLRDTLVLANKVAGAWITNKMSSIQNIIS